MKSASDSLRVLYLGFFGGDNAGDNFIHESLREFLAASSPSLVIKGYTLGTRDGVKPIVPPLYHDRWQDFRSTAGVNFQNMTQFRGFRHYLFGLFCFPQTFWWLSNAYLFRWSGRSLAGQKFFEAVQHIDCFHFVGGGYFNGHFPKELFNYWLHARCAAASCSHLKLISTGASWGPFRNAFDRWIARDLAGLLTICWLRETKSLGEIPSQCLPQVHTDEVFLQIPPLSLPGATPLRSVRKMAFNLKNFPSFSYNSAGIRRLLTSLRDEGWQVEFWAFSPADLALAKSLNLDDLLHRNIDASKLSLKATYAAMAQYDAAIGAAYHFCVIAVAAALPLVAILDGDYYTRKTQGVLMDLSLPVQFIASTEVDLGVARKIPSQRVSIAEHSRIETMRSAYRKLYGSIVAEKARSPLVTPLS